MAIPDVAELKGHGRRTGQTEPLAFGNPHDDEGATGGHDDDAASRASTSPMGPSRPSHGRSLAGFTWIPVVPLPTTSTQSGRRAHSSSAWARM